MGAHIRAPSGAIRRVRAARCPAARPAGQKQGTAESLGSAQASGCAGAAQDSRGTLPLSLPGPFGQLCPSHSTPTPRPSRGPAFSLRAPWPGCAAGGAAQSPLGGAEPFCRRYRSALRCSRSAFTPRAPDIVKGRISSRQNKAESCPVSARRAPHGAAPLRAPPGCGPLPTLLRRGRLRGAVRCGAERGGLRPDGSSRAARTIRGECD